MKKLISLLMTGACILTLAVCAKTFLPALLKENPGSPAKQSAQRQEERRRDEKKEETKETMPANKNVSEEDSANEKAEEETASSESELNSEETDENSADTPETSESPADTEESGEENGSGSEKRTGIRPEFKAAMDSYEAFYDEYCDFLIKYNKNSSDLTLFTEYMEMLKRLEEMDEKFEAWEDDDMSDEELNYYLEVTLRIEKKLLETSQKMD